VKKTIPVREGVNAANRRFADGNRALFAAHGVAVINLIGSPGCGKTTLLEETLRRLDSRLRLIIIEGDVETDLDAKRLAGSDADIIQINTHGSCHLNARQISETIAGLPTDKLEATDLIIIENVGNLVCPSSFDLGERMKVAVLSVPEGDEKPEKYPALFLQSGIALITKLDLVQYTDFNLPAARERICRLNPEARVYPLSAKTGEGMEAWITELVQLK
jgi:hydrogenase nickel incorporation protein HypB